jgi:hypothetical protein
MDSRKQNKDISVISLIIYFVCQMKPYLNQKNFQFLIVQIYRSIRILNLKQTNLNTLNTSISSGVNIEYKES